jgi:hypothetical protein
VFRTTAPFLLLDYFGAPYTLEPDSSEASHALRAVRPEQGERVFLYPGDGEAIRAGEARSWLLGQIRLFARAFDDEEMRRQLDAAGGTWRRSESMSTVDGAATTAIWRSDRGDVALPFDPNEAIVNFWSERYQNGEHSALGRLALSSLHRAYYRVRPALPRRAQIGLRRAYSKMQAQVEFPRWPIETSLHDLYDWLFRELRSVAGSAIPTIALWPKGHLWALVLTHDVEGAEGVATVDLLRQIEVSRGFRSSWNFVPHRYDLPAGLVQDLTADGFEVGVHGLEHDGRDLESLATLRTRLPEIQRYAETWDAIGFRSPATHRRWEWMPLLGFDYDSSYPDTDPYEPQPGGCCSWLPFFNQDLVELPITLPQDYTLFTILRVEDEQPWLSKTTFLRDRGGMALLITHPDYMVEQRYRDAYARLLDQFAGDETMWRALPREVSAWWRRRAASQVIRDGSGWAVSGPASEDAEILER